MAEYIKEYGIYIYLIVINIIGFSLMYIDKKRAIKNNWRIKERTLICVSIIGGSIGALVGMKLFRHKTKHPKFSYGIPVIIASQIIIYVLILLYKKGILGG